MKLPSGRSIVLFFYDGPVSRAVAFEKLLVKGETPFGKLPSLPSIEKLGASLGGAPKYPACEAFGRSPGLVGMLGDGIGLPPDWTDKGAAAHSD